MSLNRNLTNEQYHELFEYTRHVLTANPARSDIMRWVREHGYTLQNFFLAYTLMTNHGKYDKNAYRNVMNEFNEKHKIELEASYSIHRLWPNKHSPLFNSTLQQIEQDQNMKNMVSPEFNT